jgi:hypothetical protein
MFSEETGAEHAMEIDCEVPELLPPTPASTPELDSFCREQLVGSEEEEIAFFMRLISYEKAREEKDWARMPHIGREVFQDGDNQDYTANLDKVSRTRLRPEPESDVDMTEDEKEMVVLRPAPKRRRATAGRDSRCNRDFGTQEDQLSDKDFIDKCK